MDHTGSRPSRRLLDRHRASPLGHCSHAGLRGGAIPGHDWFDSGYHPPGGSGQQALTARFRTCTSLVANQEPRGTSVATRPDTINAAPSTNVSQAKKPGHRPGFFVLLVPLLRRSHARSRALLRGDPRVDARVKHVERQRAAAQHFVMEAANVELPAQLFPGPLAQLKDLQLAELIAQGLRRPGHVAVSLALYLGLVNAGVVVEVIHHLLARPVLVMEAGIDHKADGAQQIILKM